jgi:hypothetical protein
MTSHANGTDSGYASITDNYLYLNVNDSDRVYNSNISIGQLQRENIPEDFFEDYRILSQLTQANMECRSTIPQLTFQDPVSSTKATIYDLLSTYPELSECKKLVDSAGYGPELMKPYTTFFAFTNKNAGLASLWLKQFNTLGYQRELLKVHTLPFTAEPDMLKNRVIKLFNKSEGNELYVNGKAIPMYLYADSKQLNGVSYSPPMIKNNILGFLTCDNGALYILDRPLYPDLII